MVYYAETNICAIIIAIILLNQGRKMSSKNETSEMVMSVMLCLLILLSISDIAAYYFRGKSYIGVEISNTIYFFTIAMGTYAWYFYIAVKTNHIKQTKKIVTPINIPIILLCVALLCNPYTNFFFSVDEQLLYHRGPGIFVTWIVEWGYVLVALGLNIKAMIREKRQYRKQEYRGYLFYALPLVLSAVCQMFFYGTTTMQLGYAGSLLLVYLNKQFYQVQRDELTGVNNKNALLNFQDYIVGKSTPTDLKMILIDADDFKVINDKLGHMKGDQALQDIADALKLAVEEYEKNHVTIYRYGGDEFIIMGRSITDDELNQLQISIQKYLDYQNKKNDEAGEKYKLSVSMGTASSLCSSMTDFEKMLRIADEEMYQAKRMKKQKPVDQ